MTPICAQKKWDISSACLSSDQIGQVQRHAEGVLTGFWGQSLSWNRHAHRPFAPPLTGTTTITTASPAVVKHGRWQYR